MQKRLDPSGAVTVNVEMKEPDLSVSQKDVMTIFGVNGQLGRELCQQGSTSGNEPNRAVCLFVCVCLRVRVCVRV